jgi:aspartyl-tRNA(Asn)/glutamyl-tRNA(Gln) amidotransferase subunit A
MTDLTDLTIRDAGVLLARRAMSASELVAATLRRIEITEPRLHAYVRVFHEHARRAAAEADRDLARGYWHGPLHGIPLGVKDLCYTKDAPTEAGSRVLAGFVPPYDATVVQRLRSAGAIIVGKTVTHEFAWGVNVPPTRNAWNVEYYPGGSSAGSGAAVAARSAFGAIGTDTGGSIREPAALNGLVGLKPTFGRVSRHGIFPASPSFDHAGPLTRTVEDCAIMLQALAGYDARDASSAAEPVPAYTADLEHGPSGLRIGVERAYFLDDGVRPEVRAAMDAVLATYAQLGAEVVDVTIPHLNLMNVVGLTIVLTEASAYHGHFLRERQSDFDPATRVLLELGELLPGTAYVIAQRVRRMLRDIMSQVFRAYRLDALLSPTLHTSSVPLHKVSQPDDTVEGPLSRAINYLMPANVTGQPAITVPCGFSHDGLPIGFQLTGRPFDEALLLRLARAYEREHSWVERKPVWL